MQKNPTRLIAATTLAIVLGCAVADVRNARLNAEKQKVAFSLSGKIKTEITFANDSGKVRKLYWLNYKGQREKWKVLKTGESTNVSTYLTHPWLVTDNDDNGLAIYYPDSEPRTVTLK